MPIPALAPAPSTPSPGGLAPGTVLWQDITASLDGVDWNRVDADGVEWWLTQLDGWYDGPSISTVSGQRPEDHGVYAGPSWMGGRQLTVGGVILAPDQGTRDRAVDRLHAAAPFTPTAQLTVTDTIARACMVQVAGDIKAAPLGSQAAVVQVPLLAPDPRRYATPLTTLTTAMGGTPAGLTLPLTLPGSLPSQVGGDGYLTGTQQGNMAAPWTARIDGPVARPGLLHLESGRRVVFDLTLAVGEWLTLDSLNRKAFKDGVVDYTATITNDSGWWSLPEGDWTVQFLGTSSSPTSPTLTFTACDCWR